MFDAVVSVFDRIVSRPGARSVLLAVLVFGSSAVGVIGFEAYTAHFRLQRLTQTAELISSIQEIENSGLKNPELARVHKALLGELRYLVPNQVGSIVSTPPPPVAAKETLWKFLAAGTLWWLVSLVALGSVFRREPSSMIGFLGIVVFGIIFGAIGAALPTIYWPWFNLVLFPIGHFALAMIAILGFSLDLMKVSASKKIQPATEKKSG